jgi:hypothetical protein
MNVPVKSCNSSVFVRIQPVLTKCDKESPHQRHRVLIKSLCWSLNLRTSSKIAGSSGDAEDVRVKERDWHLVNRLNHCITRNSVKRIAILHRKIGDMMVARRRDAAPDKVTRAPGRRPVSYSDTGDALRRRLEQLRSEFRIETAPAAGRSTDGFLGDAPIAAFAGAAVGCLATEHFSAFGIVPGIASALATVLVCGLLLVTRTTRLFAGTFFSALYGGSFAGMTPIAWLGGDAAGALAVTLAVVCGAVFFVVASLDSRSAAPIGIGCGGRLGAVAVAASFLFVELIGPLGADTGRLHAVAAGAFDLEPLSAIRAFLVCLVGIFFTLFVLRQPGIADGGVAVRIFTASVAALLGLVVLHFGNPDDLAAIDAFYAGCFLGMSTPDRLKGWFQPISGAVVLIVVLVPVRAYLNGFGGGLGLAAFIAVMLIVCVRRATAWTTRNGSLAKAIASAAIAVFLMIGLISTEPVAEDVLVSVGTPAPEPAAELPDPTPVRLVVGKPAQGTADQAIPIGISLINAAADDVVFLSGLPSGSTITNGRSSATGGWQLMASELADAAISPGRGFVGGADIAVELRHADQSVVDRGEMHLEWTGPAPQAIADVAPPLTASLSAAPLPDAVTLDNEALFRTFLQSRGHAKPETRGTAHPSRAANARMTASAPYVRSQAAAWRPNLLVAPLANGAVRPRQPVVRRADFSDQQRKPAPKSPLPAFRQDHPIPESDPDSP